eukprot:g29270.t1
MENTYPMSKCTPKPRATDIAGAFVASLPSSPSELTILTAITVCHYETVLLYLCADSCATGRAVRIRSKTFASIGHYATWH